MNLTDGSIHCGRRNFDGSGGNNHAVDHYEETKYPLVTKLNYFRQGYTVKSRFYFYIYYDKNELYFK